MDSSTTGIAANAASAVASAAASASGGSSANTLEKNQDGTTAAAPAATPAQEPLPQRDPRSLQFQVDGNRVITTIVDKNDNTVVVQIPDADVIRIAKAIDRMRGFLVEEKA